MIWRKFEKFSRHYNYKLIIIDFNNVSTNTTSEQAFAKIIDDYYDGEHNSDGFQRPYIFNLKDDENLEGSGENDHL